MKQTSINVTLTPWSANILVISPVAKLKIDLESNEKLFFLVSSLKHFGCRDSQLENVRKHLNTYDYKRQHHEWLYHLLPCHIQWELKPHPEQLSLEWEEIRMLPSKRNNHFFYQMHGFTIFNGIIQWCFSTFIRWIDIRPVCNEITYEGAIICVENDTNVRGLLVQS